MPVTNFVTDEENLTMVMTADLAAPVERVWAAFTDPRQLERFWGPPGWPATFTYFDHQVGGKARYHMTSPRGEKSQGGWEFLTINPPHEFEVLDSFLDDEGQPIEDMLSMRVVYRFEATPDGTRLTNTTYFNDLESLQMAVEMGAVEGSTLAMNQLDRVLQGLREFAQGQGTRLEYLDDQHVRITRLIEGPRELVWQAHNDPALIRRWMLGPDGWSMPVCEPPREVGAGYRFGWAPDEGAEGEEFGFEGELLISEPPRRLVTTERMAGTEGPSTINDMILEEEDGATLVVLVIEYPDKETRDMILATGMVDGMESSFRRLEEVLQTV